jgi:hypothetical protein
MDVKVQMEINDNVMKINGIVDDSGNQKVFQREFVLSNKRNTKSLETDSRDYQVLANAVKEIKNVPGMICEIGTRRGGSMKVIIDNLLQNQDYYRNIVCIDPYGNIDYPIGEKENRDSLKLNYTNEMRNEAIPAIYEYVQNKPVNILIQCMEDTEFFKRFADGVPFYNEYKIVETNYALVFFDGPHTLEALLEEIDFYQSRCVEGSVWVFDDIELYLHDLLEEKLFKHSWELIEKTSRKASYRSVKKN